jgi:hypothetical protein
MADLSGRVSTMSGLKSFARLAAPVALLLAQPLYAQNDSPAALFALMDKNEWCPAGSVYVDLRTGAFLLRPRLQRPACQDPKSQAPVERGRLDQASLLELRSASAKAREAGLARKICLLRLSNGGPEALTIFAPGLSATTPENEGCWSDEATALHDRLYRLFGQPRQPRK